ncbi:MAG: hypothetical protein K8J31_24700 [Anaerolineae bacterium]|nr:hypothetical protein [Anaerolineae bacterium]
MNRLAIVVGLVLLLLIGGGLTTQLMSGGSNPLFIMQTTSPDASTLSAAPWQAEQLVIFIGFVLFNLIGMAVTIMIVMWFLHRGVKQAHATENAVTAGGDQ